MTRSPIATGGASAVAGSWRRRTAQDGADARDQLAGGEGLDDVVVGAELQAGDAVGLLAARGEQDDRDARALLLAHPAHDLQPVDPGHHQVEHDEVRPAAREGVERRVAVRDDLGVVAGALEVARDDLADRRLVVDHQDRGVGVRGLRHRRRR
jgi:hypothetical protein